MNGLDRNPSPDLTRSTLGVLFIIGLIAASFWILRPFLTALLWATMIVVSTWPLLVALQARLNGRRGAAAAILTGVLLLILIVPLGVAAGSVIANLDNIVGAVKAMTDSPIPPLPDWVAQMPFVGPKIASAWLSFASQDASGLMARVTPWASRFVQWFAGQLGSLGAMILQFLLTVIVSAVLYVNGETAGTAVVRFAARLAGSNGTKAALLAAGAIRAVAMGVLGTALVQTTIAGAGLLIAAVPAAMLLTSGVLVLCLAQLGPILVMLPAVVWKFYSGDTFWATVLLVFAVVSTFIDNFLRPLLIRRGADLPLLLIFAGVIGGMISAGIMGIFAGPVILAVTHTLLKQWVTDTPESAASAST
jgi:predicted PurR-regulated permease PerM